MSGYSYKAIAKSGSSATIVYGINPGEKTKYVIEVGDYLDASGKYEPFVDVNGTITAFDSKQLGGATATARGINDLGVAVGSYRTGAAEHGFVYDNGNFIAVNYPKASSTEVTAINNSNKIVGTYFDSTGEHGFIAQVDKSGKTVTGYKEFNLASSQGTSITGIDSNGDIVGDYVKGNGEHGFLKMSNGSFKTITYPGATSTTATGINDKGQITGTYTDAAGKDHGFVMDKAGTFTAIDDPHGTSTFANGINEAGQIVGQYESGKGGRYHTGFIATPARSQLAHALFEAAFGGAPVADGDLGHAASPQAGLLSAAGDAHAHAPSHVWKG